MVGKLIEIDEPGQCSHCGRNLVTGSKALLTTNPLALICHSCATSPPPTDVAGRSARQLYERRASQELARNQQKLDEDAKWRRVAKQQHPILGRAASAVTAKPKIGPESQQTRAWKVGAEGEERVAQVLAGVPGIEVLHDRKLPQRVGNFDHIVVGASGVFLIDAKKYKQGSQIEVRDKGSLFRSDERLYVAERDRTKLVHDVLKGVFEVRKVLAPEFASIPVRGVLCFIGCYWGMFKRPKTVLGVTTVWPAGLPKLVSASGNHGELNQLLAARLRARLVPAGR